MDETELFKKTASARTVAQDGYDAMLAGKLDVISGVTLVQRLMLLAARFTPKKFLLSQVRTMQESTV